MAEELHTMLRNAGEKPPYIVVGHSYGSWIAQMFAHQFPDETVGVALVDGMGPAGAFALRKKLWLRFLQWTSPFGLPRWRGWCAGRTPGVRFEAEAANCRSRVFAAYYAEWSQLGASSKEMGTIQGLGTLPLVVISRDPAHERNADQENRHAQQQRDLLQLSSDSRLVTANDSGHDVPGERPDVVIEAVQNVIRLQGQGGSPGTP